MVDNTNKVRTEHGAIESTERAGVTRGHATVHGVRLYYERAGQGRPLVFLHAGIADHRMWDTQFFALAEEFEVIRYDLRGYGQSLSGEIVDPKQAAQSGYDYPHSQDLYSLLRTLEVEAATLIGSSLGGSVAIDFALEQPAMTKGLVLVGAVPSGFEFVGEVPVTLQRFMDAYQAGDMAQAAEMATQLWFDGSQRQPERMNQSMRVQVKTMMSEVLTDSALDFGDQHSASQPAVEHLHQIMAPTLVVIGDLDEENVQEAANLLADEIPMADRVKIADAAHLPNLEKPDKFYRVVYDFLDRIAELDLPESDLAMGVDGAVPRKIIAPNPEDR